MNAFKNLTDILELKTIRVVYQALIVSIISYGISTWGGYNYRSTKTNIE